MDIGRRLEEARHAIGYTLEKTSEESGIGKSSISEFENSKREPKFSQLSKLAEVYKRTIEFFLTEERPVEEVMLWREVPDAEEEKKAIEAKFRQLCEQYYRLEVLTGEIKRKNLPGPECTVSDTFDYNEAEAFARRVRKELALGDRPGVGIGQMLEETYYLKIFYDDFYGSAISTVSDVFGPAVLLNRKNKKWRRNYDLAHELFHILTWTLFRSDTSPIPSDFEEKLANVFASHLLLPEEPIRERIAFYAEKDGNISLSNLDDIAREFCVSLDALICRISRIYNIPSEKTKTYREYASKMAQIRVPRESDLPYGLPPRYSDLAVRALREGKISLIQFAKYMGITYKKAQEYLAEEEDFTDEKISISVA